MSIISTDQYPNRPGSVPGSCSRTVRLFQFGSRIYCLKRILPRKIFLGSAKIKKVFPMPTLITKQYLESQPSIIKKRKVNIERKKYLNVYSSLEQYETMYLLLNHIVLQYSNKKHHLGHQQHIGN